MSVLETLHKRNLKKINDNTDEISDLNEKSEVSSFTYGFVSSTLSEAQSFTTTTFEFRFITNARKSGEGAGNGTGLPSFYDISSAAWVDLLGTAITV